MNSDHILGAGVAWGCIALLNLGIYFYQRRKILNTHDLNHRHHDCSNTEENYTPLSPEAVDYIASLGVSVTEVCAGNGKNADLLREKGVDVHAYDVKSITGKVLYGVNGLIENNHNSDMLMICSGFDVWNSVSRFKGKHLMIGGLLTKQPNLHRKEYIYSFENMEPVMPQKCYGDQTYELELRPQYTDIVNLGWKFSKAFVFPVNKVKWASAYVFYFFTRE
jgi:hypothetical protein